MKYQILAALTLVLGAVGAANADTIYPANDGFELPNLGSGAGAYAYSPAGGIWTFVGGAGIAANGSAFNVSGATNGNHDGTTSDVGQAGFIQGGNGNLTGSYISQVIALPSGTAKVTFALEERPNLGAYAGFNSVDVKIDNFDLGIYAAATTGSFTTFTTGGVNLGAGNHTLYFIGTGGIGGDQTQFIDNVQLSSVPEPATLTMLGFGVVSMVGYGWRRRKQAARVAG